MAHKTTKPSRFRRFLRSIQQRFARYRQALALGVLGMFLATLGLAMVAKKPAAETSATTSEPLLVETMQIGSSSARIRLSGTVKNLQSVTLVAQSPGPVKSVKVRDGQTVSAGTIIMAQESAYGAGSAAFNGYTLAQKQAELAEVSLRATEQSVATTRAVAQTNRDNTEELRKISASTVDGAKAVVGNTRSIIAVIQAELDAETDPAAQHAIRQQLVGYQSSLLQAETTLRNLEYSTNKEKAPTELADLALRQVQEGTELQLQTARLQKEIADLGVRSAAISVAASQVRAPFAGRVERVFVHPGEYLNPGTPVAKMVGAEKLTLLFTASGEIASRLQAGNMLTIQTPQGEVLVPITTVTQTPTAGKQYEIIARIDSEFHTTFREGQSVDAQVWIAQPATQVGTLIPLDAVFVTNTTRSVLVLNNGTAEHREVRTGIVLGDAIEILDGLQDGDRVILDRRVVSGMAVREE